jgi:membrane-associated phospholipid phosphatase
MKGVIGKIAFVLLLSASLILGWFARNYLNFPGDLEISSALQTVQSRWSLAAMEGVSWIVDSWKGAIVVLIAAFIFWRAYGKMEGIVLLAAGLFTAANELFKLVVNRPRPTADAVHVFAVETGKSFPSGHAFFAVAIIGLIAYLAVIHTVKPSRKFIIGTVSVFLILWIGISRIYLGVHWASDVAGGYLAGGVFLLLEIWLYHRYQPRFSIKSS